MVVKKILSLTFLAFVAHLALSQTLFLPSGTGGIGTSLNSNIGIGINSPIDYFHVQFDDSDTYSDSDMQNNGLWVRNLNNSSNNGIHTSIRLLASGNNGSKNANGAINLIQPSVSSHDSEFSFQLRRQSGNFREVMRLTSLGNIGVGTTNPNAGLHIQNKDLLVSNDVATGGTGIAKVIFSEGSNESAAIGFSINYDGDNLSGGNNKLYFESPSQGEVFTIRNDGNIGIGTATTSGYKLAVEGTIAAREVKVESATWPDYVFADDYDLRSLEDTKTFIRQNHHLPEIPSASEVEENGVLLGEMNKKLLQKIEELTLHLIEQHERMDNLEKKLAELTVGNHE